MDFVRPLLGLAPVLCFLGALVLLDSYKLVKLRWVVMAVVGGMAIAGIAYFVNGALLEHFEFAFYTRYVSPFVEEGLKALVIVALIRAHRIGFLVDAAICFVFLAAGRFAERAGLRLFRSWRRRGSTVTAS